MCYTSRVLWNLIAVYSMILACGLSVAAITGLVTYYCSFQSFLSKFQFDNTYLTYVIYFYNDNCADNQTDFIVKNHAPSDRTWAWTIAYLILNAFWFITTLLLLQAQNYWKTTRGSWLPYPWIFTTIGVLCTDIGSTTMYTLDYYENLQNISDLSNFMELEVLSKSKTEFSYYPVPSILMVGIFSKGVLGWVLLLFGFGIICFIVHQKRRNQKELLVLQTRPPPFGYHNGSAVNPAYEQEMTELHNSSPTSQQPRVQENGYWGAPWQLLPRLPTRLSMQNDQNNQWKQQPGPQPPSQIIRAWENEEERQNRPPNDAYMGQRPWSYLPSSSQPQPTETFPQPYKNDNALYY